MYVYYLLKQNLIIVYFTTSGGESGLFQYESCFGVRVIRRRRRDFKSMNSEKALNY